VDEKDVAFVKINEFDNCADGLTKPIAVAPLHHHYSHTHPHFSFLDGPIVMSDGREMAVEHPERPAGFGRGTPHAKKVSYASAVKSSK
jgi:hypothetical protein